MTFWIKNVQFEFDITDFLKGDQFVGFGRGKERCEEKRKEAECLYWDFLRLSNAISKQRSFLPLPSFIFVDPLMLKCASRLVLLPSLALSQTKCKLGADSQEKPGVLHGKVTCHDWKSTIYKDTLRQYYVYPALVRQDEKLPNPSIPSILFIYGWPSPLHSGCGYP